MRRCCLAALLVAALVEPSLAQTIRLEFVGRPRLIDCDRPCFRMDVTAVDAQGQPVTMDDRAPLSVFQNDEPVDVVVRRPLRVTPSAGPSEGSPSQMRRVSLVLFDTSGSMNERLPGSDTKFMMARRQLERLLATFQEGVDRMAIAPFDSQRVADRIRAVGFEATRAGIRRQIAALQPRPRGNTALFSAVFEGLQILRSYAQEDGQVSLIVFTDGKNDVRHPSDDPGLLDGDEGLRAVTALAQDVGVTVYTIGYGAPGVSFDEASLQALKYPPDSSNYFNAQSEARLTQIFTTIARRGGTGVRLLVHARQTRREQLTGESVSFRVVSGKLAAESPVWRGNPLMTPSYEGPLTTEERLAVLKTITRTEGPLPTGANPVIVRMAVLLGYSAVLAGLWFGVPRLIWPDRYIPKPALRPQAGRPQPRPGGRPGAPPSRSQSGSRADVTVAHPRQSGPGRPAHGPAHGTERSREAAPRGRESSPSPAAPRPREPWAGREAGDATVFIPPSKKPGGST
jgi:Ca-activated chloride channel family protein